ncbi:hypothetical protein EV421DRAFT_2022628 [Armillaria borealis]|uniref:Uncharacterized protein n=1 Tax=Armillaria borealis TaxID=47425 RepID=A0AA39J5S8_9AGAR|nr:hypothetical protein EV421DRAFT_2022628 [Armillaria borealis]
MTRTIDTVLVALMEWRIVENIIVVALGCLEKVVVRVEEGGSHREVVVVVRGKGECIGGDGGGLATMTGLVMVYNGAVAPSKGVDTVAAVLEALEKSLITVPRNWEWSKKVAAVFEVGSSAARLVLSSCSKKKERITHHATKIDSQVDYAALPPHRHCPILASNHLASPRGSPSSPRRLRAKRREGGAWALKRGKWMYHDVPAVPALSQPTWCLHLERSLPCSLARSDFVDVVWLGMPDGFSDGFFRTALINKETTLFKYPLKHYKITADCQTLAAYRLRIGESRDKKMENRSGSKRVDNGVEYGQIDGRNKEYYEAHLGKREQETGSIPGGALQVRVRHFPNTDRFRSQTALLHPYFRGISPAWNALGTGIARNRCPFVHLFNRYRWTPKSAFCDTESLPRWLYTRFPNIRDRHEQASTKNTPAGAGKTEGESSYVEEDISPLSPHEPDGGYFHAGPVNSTGI